MKESKIIKKILLVAINAKYIHSNLAVYSLKAYAQKAFAQRQGREVEIEIAEYTINHAKEEVLEDLYRRKADVIAFSCYIWNWGFVSDLLTEIPKIMPTLELWLGGPEVSYDAQNILKEFPMIDGIMIGEGEETFAALVGYYAKGGGKLQEIQGLFLRSGYTGERACIDMDQIPFIYQSLDAFENRILYYESSRGCPFSCSYCLSSIEKKLRFRSLSLVKEELLYFLEHRVSQVKFIDRTFNCMKEHTLEIWRFLQEHDNGITNFHFEVAADLLEEEELTLLEGFRPGCIQLEVGVQTTNELTVEAIQRKMNLEKLAYAVQRIHSYQNIHLHLDLIAGLPLEDKESFANSFNQVYALCPQQLQLGFLKVLKGSPIYKQALAYGINYNTKPPYEVLYSNWMSYEDIRCLKGVEQMLELYYNSGQFAYTMYHLEAFFPDAFAMYDALASFYEKEGYRKNQPSRIYRYDVLLQFIDQIEDVPKGFFREALTLDLYLQENMKSRPAFSSNQEAFKDRIQSFYRKEEVERLWLPDYEAYDKKQMARMTHIEIFVYQVWKKERDIAKACVSDGETMVLFDYQKKDLLCRQASLLILEAERINEDEETGEGCKRNSTFIG